MERTKVVLIIGLGLILTLPLVCWLDKPSKKSTQSESVEITPQEKEEREKKKTKQEEKTAKGAALVRLRERTEAILKSEWKNASVEINGGIEVGRNNEDGDYEVFKFHVTGVTVTNKNGAIVLSGAIVKETDLGSKQGPVSSFVVSNNPTLPDLLDKFRTAVMEAE